MAVYFEQGTQSPTFTRPAMIVNIAGAIVSLVLVVGIIIWAYQLIQRDVSGVPVVRALQGDMRVAPEDPGGDLALHAGLSVNTIAAEGEAADPEDTLYLAPATTELSQDELAAQPLAEAAEPRVADTQAEETLQEARIEVEPEQPSGPMSAEDLLALAEMLAARSQPLSELAPGEDIPPQVTLDGQAVAEETTDSGAVSASVPGVAVSIRPALRPARVSSAQTAPSVDNSAVAAALALAVAETAPAQSETAALLSAQVPKGTILVQLGAFPSAEQAALQWGNLLNKFDSYLTTKTQVIQEAKSGGQTFYRLRAAGFDTTGDARRFCAAMAAGQVDCIPVVAR
jgi:hypothetical protein